MPNMLATRTAGHAVTQPRCDTCRFFEPPPRDGNNPPLCRRHAPVARLFWKQDIDDCAIWATWPKVLDSDWCGEWEAKHDS
jgi:hypothetical protein